MGVKYFLHILALLILIQLGEIESQSITLYREVNVQEEKLELIVSTCTSSLSERFVQSISCGNFTVDCAQFYDTENCTGNSAELRKDSVDKLPWKFEKVKSIGPCNPSSTNVCKPNGNTNVPNVTEFFSTKIELFEHADFKGPHVIIKVFQGCISLPRKLKNRVSSIRFDGGVCVELHESWNCSPGASIRIRRRIPTAINLADWGFDDKTTSVSHCRYPNPCLTSKIDKPSIILYKVPNVEGNSMSLVVDLEGEAQCITLDYDWLGLGAIASFKMHRECLVLYTSFECSKAGTENQTIIRKPMNETDRHVSWHDLKLLMGFDGIIRSIGLCDEDMMIKSKVEHHSSCEHITLYDERNLTGNSRSISAVAQCVDLDDEWEGATESIRLYKQCLMAYTHFGCPTENTVSLELRKAGNEIHEDWPDLELRGFDGVIRSIGPCIDDMPKKSPLTAIYMALGMFCLGISVATFVNWIVRKRERRESSMGIKTL